MKKIALLIFLASCGKYEGVSNENASLGQNLVNQPRQMSQSDLLLKETICRGIDAKTTRMSLMNAQALSFSLEQKNCSGEVSPALNVDVTIQVNNDSIFFQRSDNGQFFVFKDAETMRSGIMRSFCSSTQNPFTHNGIVTWWDKCQTSTTNRSCVMFKSGLETITNQTFNIKTIESFIINTDVASSRYGYYVERKIVSNLSCENAEATEVRATLN